MSVVVAAPAPPRARHRLVTGADDPPLAWRSDGGAKGIFLDDATPDGTPDRVDRLCEAFGFDPASVEAETVDWARDPFAGGTYVVFEPGQLVRHGPHLRRPHGRVEFAGAERSSWPDSMEGAVESGWAAAERVAGRLSAERTSDG